jgi:hypothetical protein
MKSFSELYKKVKSIYKDAILLPMSNVDLISDKKTKSLDWSDHYNKQQTIMFNKGLVIRKVKKNVVNCGFIAPCFIWTRNGIGGHSGILFHENIIDDSDKFRYPLIHTYGFRLLNARYPISCMVRVDNLFEKIESEKLRCNYDDALKYVEYEYNNYDKYNKYGKKKRKQSLSNFYDVYKKDYVANYVDYVAELNVNKTNS